MTEILTDSDELYSFVVIDNQKFIDFENYIYLRDRLELAKQALEYYANTSNWINNDEDSENSVIERRDLECIEYNLKKNYSITINTGGRVARECLKNIGE